MDMVTVVAWLLVLQGVLGAFDTFVNHEWRERLPHRPWAARELALHALRSAHYTVVFAGIAWLDWHGRWGWVMLGIMSLEYVVTLADSVQEDRTRRLAPVERVNHMLLALNSGIYMAAFAAQMAWVWLDLPTALARGSRPWPLVLILSFCAVVTAVWAVRDAIAWQRMKRLALLATEPAIQARG
jgi:hypothetical protein